MVKVMFDTNVFNHLVDGEIESSDLPKDWEPIITHVQRDELAATRNDERRKALQEKLFEVAPETVLTETAVWGVWRWGEAKWATSASRYTEVYAKLERLRAKSNNAADAVIADTCLQNDCMLVTNDGPLKAVTIDCGGKVSDFRR